MTTQQTQSAVDLAAIKSKIASQQSDLQRQIEQTRADLDQAKLDLDSFQRNRQNILNELQPLQAEQARLEQAVRQAEADATHARGTSLEHEKAAALKHLNGELSKVTAEAKALTDSSEHDDGNIQFAKEQVQAAVGQLDQLQRQYNELSQTYARFDQEHFQSVYSYGLLRQQKMNAQLAAAKAATDQLEKRAEEEQLQWARELAEFESPEKPRASQTLIEHGTFAPAPAVQLLEAKLAMAHLFEEHGAEIGPGVVQLFNGDIPYQAMRDFGSMAAYRQRQTHVGRDQDYWSGVPALRQYEAHLAQLQQGLADLRRQNQQVQARQLLNTVNK
jgi:chromosome segregation ATPase